MNNNIITFSLLEKIEKANKDFSLFESVTGIVVGFSGGADSTCLLLALKELSQRYGFGLCALHVNHMIRHEEADRDEDFARNLCEKYGIDFLCERIDVPALADCAGQSLELCARNVRYELFLKACKKKGMNCIATAHNACDNAETVIFNLARGSGLKGLCGIPPKRLFDGVTVIRPLIYAERSEIEAYLGQIGQTYVTDSTNNETEYTRNFVRHEILPQLRKINPSLEQTLCRTFRLLADDEEYLRSVAEKNMTDDIACLKTMHRSILSRVILQKFAEKCDETPAACHIEELCEKIYTYDGRKVKVSFAGCMSACLCDGKLSFEKDSRRKKEKNPEFCAAIGEGSAFFEENPYALYISFDRNKDIPQTLKNAENVYKIYTTDYLYFDTIPHVFFARNRRDGDKIFTSKMNKSVKRIFNDSGFDEKQRYSVPFITDGERILLIPSVAVNDECKHNGKRDKCISITLYIKDTKE